MKGPPTDLVPARFPTPFSDQAVPQEVASALRQSAERIRRFGEQQNTAMLAIGRELAGAKELLPSHLFGPWIRKEFGMADETASGYMAATREISADPPSGKNSPKAFYSDEFDDDFLSRIPEVDPGAFEKHPVRSEGPTGLSPRRKGKG